MDRSLRRAVLERLAAVEDIAMRAGSQLSVRMARSHLKTITGGWRELLIEHQPDLRGRCPVCSGWLRRRRWPCQVWVTAHHHLIGGELPEPAGWSPKKANPFRRPRQVEVIPRQTNAPSAAEQSSLNQPGPEPTGPESTGAGPTRAEAASVKFAGPEFAGTEFAGTEPATAEPARPAPAPAEHAAAAVRVTGRRGTDADIADQRTGELPAIGLPQMPADIGEIHRAAIAEWTPTLPRSRRSWRSRS